MGSPVNIISILIVNDFSIDRTGEETIRISKDFNYDIEVYSSNKNLGYGGVQKFAYKYAIMKNFEYVIMLHGDGQYAPEELPKLLNGLHHGKFDVVIGSRMIKKKDALKGGMPLYKLVGNVILTKIQIILLKP